MGGWLGGWMDGWMKGWMDGWTDVCVCYFPAININILN